MPPEQHIQDLTGEAIAARPRYPSIPTPTPPCLPGHIVVLGSVHGSSSFIEPLREKQARQEDIDALKPIVIVSPEYDAAEVKEYRRL